MNMYMYRDTVRTTPLKRENIVPLLLPLLPAKSRPKLAEVRHVPLGMFMSLYGNAFTIGDGKRVFEKKVMDAFNNAGSRHVLRRQHPNSPDAAFFEFIELDKQQAMFQQQHWSHYPDLYRKLQPRVFDLNYRQWEKLEHLLADLYLRPEILMMDPTDQDAQYMLGIMHGRLQVWSNILTLANARPETYHFDDWV